ncbi:transcriptional regulator, AraC family [Rhodospirillum rubrum ATCC 11170]|uniref:Transcriptional regulator, AraC family n=2 Tax=Rhodospirillum rubrum TaxID=1085 RepID=Q2RVL5_RHORT|nr:transcriptional regulator, AraC family [Rhodospirillum rubrum ATCC 11170]MBK5953387.1 AraC family transcriptional regulator [Rhodospirillum rubrum]QXG81491.1 AraC family transcriptional regulator [Rhodospirillum rubrum]HAP99586.1 AraC family transcriptional regulator [Rhodospirillum rubrum]HCF17239.1 AraC family transcriptional regulator [Rhodospirillum rubrum]
MSHSLDSRHMCQNRLSFGQRNILAAAACGIAQGIRAQGADADAVFIKAGVRESDLGDPRLSLDLGSYVAMFELAAVATGNDNFGLWFGQGFLPPMLGLIGEIALCSPTLGSALDNLATLFPFHQQATQTRLRRDGTLLRLEYRILDGRIIDRRQDAELTMGMFANVLRAALGPGWRPEEVHFEHPRPEGWAAHGRAFDADIHFGQPTNALVFRDRDRERPMPAGDLGRLTRLRDELLSVSGGTGRVPFVEQVRGETRRLLTEGAPHIEDVAEALGLARWTLQRRLADEGLSFSDVVDDLRRTLAKRYVSQPHVPLADIAQFLGYSEPSAFSRAFVRWFGISAQQMRRAEAA